MEKFLTFLCFLEIIAPPHWHTESTWGKEKRQTATLTRSLFLSATVYYKKILDTILRFFW